MPVVAETAILDILKRQRCESIVAPACSLSILSSSHFKEPIEHILRSDFRSSHQCYNPHDRRTYSYHLSKRCRGHLDCSHDSRLMKFDSPIKSLIRILNILVLLIEMIEERQQNDHILLSSTSMRLNHISRTHIARLLRLDAMKTISALFGCPWRITRGTISETVMTLKPCLLQNVSA